MNIRLKWNRSQRELWNRIFDEDTKLYLHTRLHVYCSPYVPMDSGTLDQTVEITPEYVHYKSPYAHFQWEGNVFVDDRGSPYARRNASKHATDRELHYSLDQHPLATAHWEQAMMAAKGDALCADVTAYLRERG